MANRSRPSTRTTSTRRPICARAACSIRWGRLSAGVPSGPGLSVCALKGQITSGGRTHSNPVGEGRVRNFLRRGHQVTSQGTRQFPAERVYGTLGYFDSKDHGPRVRESTMKPVGKPDAGNRHVRFDERGWETGPAHCVSTRAHPRLYPAPTRLQLMLFLRQSGPVAVTGT